jgi:hypothetical protein
MQVINHDSTNYSLCDTYKIFTIKNVIHYTLTNCNSYKIHYLNEENNENYYLILDFPFSSALFHWIAECAIYFNLFFKLKEQYKNIKMVFLHRREYHNIICEYFNIFKDDYVYAFPKNNNCIFTLPISPLNNTYINEDYKLYSTYFIKSINGIDDKTIDLLILPRQKKDNYHNRINNCDDILSNLKQATVLNTDGIDSFKTQISLVQSSKTIILTDGSPFFLNGIIAKNSKIIVLGDVVISQSKQFPKLKYYLDLILENNTVIFIPYTNSFYNNVFLYKDIKDYL